MPERWKKSGAIAAQLFRDIFFGKYQRRPDGKYDLNEIFNDPSRPYHTLTKNSFYKHIEEISDRVEAYKRDGSGLQTEAFRRLCRLHNPPPPEDRAPIVAEETGDDDSSFSLQASDESITLGDVDTLESAIKDLNINGGEIEDVQFPSTPERKMKKEEKLEAMNQDTFLKYSFSEADGRFGYVYHVPSGFDGTFELSDDGKKVVKKEIMQHWMYDAVAVYERMGLDANNVHVVGLQASMNEKKKDDIKKMGQNPRTQEGEIWRKTEAFDLGYEAEPYFIDNGGEQTTDVWIDGTSAGGEWVFFWLKKKQERVGTSARLNRNRRRSRMDQQDSNPTGRARNEGGAAMIVDTNGADDDGL